MERLSLSMDFNNHLQEVEQISFAGKNDLLLIDVPTVYVLMMLLYFLKISLYSLIFYYQIYKLFYPC